MAEPLASTLAARPVTAFSQEPSTPSYFTNKALFAPVINVLTPTIRAATIHERRALLVILLGIGGYSIGAVVQQMLSGGFHITAGLYDWVAAAVYGVVGGVFSLGTHLSQGTFDPRTVVTTSGLSPKEELSVLRYFLNELHKERKVPGSGSVAKVVVITDQHGAIDRFDALTLDAMKSVFPNRPFPTVLRGNIPIASQLQSYGISLSDFKGKLFFKNLGDLMDRGDAGVQVFRHVKELVLAGLSSCVTGNHDVMEMLGAAGYHLPFYEGYETYGYRDRWGAVAELVAEHRAHEPEPHQAKWWAERLADYQQYQDQQQVTRWKPVHADVLQLWSTVSESLKNYPDQERIWNQLRGWYLVDIQTGTRAVGSMSVNWWKDLLVQFEKQYKITQSSSHPEEVMLAWEKAMRLIQNDIITPLEQDLQYHAVADNGPHEWWWRVFEALNYGNYRTPEWYGKDWVFHRGWAPSVFSELSREPIGVPVTNRNYLGDARIQEIADFLKKTFNLHLRDIYQNDYQHAFIPVDPVTREMFFRYKGVEYRGAGRADPHGYPSVAEGQEIVSKDIREKSYAEIHEALSLVISWYADMTTQSKPQDIVRALRDNEGQKHGEAYLHANGKKRQITGHVPLSSFDDPSMRDVVQGYRVGNNYFMDMGMTRRNGRRGGALHFTVNGVLVRGFEHSTSDTIVDHPRTIVLSPESDVEPRVIFENKGLSRAEFLPQLIEDVENRISHLTAAQRRLASPSDQTGGDTTNAQWRSDSDFFRPIAKHRQLILPRHDVFKGGFEQELHYLELLALKEQEEGNNPQTIAMIFQEDIPRLAKFFPERFLEEWDLIRNILLQSKNPPHWILWNIGQILRQEMGKQAWSDILKEVNVVGPNIDTLIEEARLRLSQFKNIDDVDVSIRELSDILKEFPAGLRGFEALEELALTRPEIFSERYLTLVRKYFPDQKRKYMEYYLSMKDPRHHDIDPALFPAHGEIQALLGTGPKKVLIVHNVEEGLGDEVIRNGSLIQALLDLNPALTIDIYTTKDLVAPAGYDSELLQLYNHPRIHLFSIPRDGEIHLSLGYDMVLRRYAADSPISNPTIEDQLTEYLDAHPPAVYFYSEGSIEAKSYSELRVGHYSLQPIEVGLEPKAQYNVGYRLLAELGLKFRTGDEWSDPRDHFLMNLNESNKQTVDRLWHDRVTERNVHGRPVLYLNPFSNPRPEKGFLPEEFGILAGEITQLLQAGFFVVLQPNGATEQWIEKEILSLLPEYEFHNIGLAPPIAHKHFMMRSDLLATVEGGAVHIAYHLGKAFVSVNYRRMGTQDLLEHWMPKGSTLYQRLFRPKRNFAVRVIGLAHDLGLELFSYDKAKLPRETELRESA